MRFDPGAPDLLAEVAWIYKLHIILGLTLFLITPFTRLVHIWSVPGLVPVPAGAGRSCGPWHR